jgi:hypothetical protein
MEIWIKKLLNKPRPKYKPQEMETIFEECSLNYTFGDMKPEKIPIPLGQYLV